MARGPDPYHSRMSLSGLLVLHRRKTAGVMPRALFAGRRLQPFHLETCLRELWIIDGAASRASMRLPFVDDVERFTGARAYEFVLRIGCGLDSEIKGESDVFGQLRDAWRAFASDHPDRAGVLEPLVQRLFEDVRDIRSRHLSGSTTITYGGLARRLLGEHAQAPTLLVGAGRMAQAILPYLAAHPVYLWNRSPERVSELATAAARESSASPSIRVLPCTREAELAAWRTATNAIVCIPPDAKADAERIGAWQDGARARGRVIHLGLLTAADSAWSAIAGLATLTDLFGLQATHNALRRAQLAPAASACREKANLRSLGGPLSLAHGWEDLSLFASTG